MLGQFMQKGAQALGQAYNQNRDLWLQQLQAGAMGGNYMKNLTAIQEQARQAALQKRKQEAIEKYREQQLEKQQQQLDQAKAQQEALNKYRDEQTKLSKEEIEATKKYRDDQTLLAKERNRIARLRAESEAAARNALAKEREQRGYVMPKTKARMLGLPDPDTTSYQVNPDGTVEPVGRLKWMERMMLGNAQNTINPGMLGPGAGPMRMPPQAPSMRPGQPAQGPYQGYSPGDYEQFLPR